MRRSEPTLHEVILGDVPEAAGPTRPVAVVVTAWNRPAYVARCLASLARSDLRGATLIIVDDGSDDPRTRALVRHYVHPGAPVVKIIRDRGDDNGPHAALRVGWDFADRALGCRVLTNLDSDTIVRPDWLPTCRALHDRLSKTTPHLIVTGFHTYRHRVITHHRDHRIKRSIGGANMLLGSDTYRAVIRPQLAHVDWDRRVGDDRLTPPTFAATRPSVVQHLGIHGTWSNPFRGFDLAVDYWVDAPWAEHAVRITDHAWRRTTTLLSKLTGGRFGGRAYDANRSR